ncbi:MAG: prepilin-type N-terminal cleavage/methylation domain-containing protein [Planctomycetaceae bacterium]|jgi:prepilin-type N-terminal cleavage/methylation domain-containing protein|nr:prepilin-type N-terminal cleavage/methylation domain-containing protein [Planctomycetaceae bacterium]
MKKNKAFTLVELLVVVVIIGILAVIITAAVAGALRSAKQARIGIELSQIATAIELYKNEFGEYPPDMFDDTALVRHVKKRWPRFELPPKPASASTISEVVWQSDCIRRAITRVYLNKGVGAYPDSLWQQWGVQQIDVSPSTLRYTNLTNLALWLGGVVQPDGKMAGFGADPEAPFGRMGNGSGTPNNGDEAVSPTDVGLGTPDRKAFLDLEVGKNIALPSHNNEKTFPCLISRLNSDKVVPIIYFCGQSSGGPSAYFGDHARQSTINDSLDSYNFSPEYSVSRVNSFSYWGEMGTAAAYADKGSLVPGRDSGGQWEKGQLLNGKWFGAETYQLIHPGLDGKFGKKIEGANLTTVGDVYFRSLENLSQEDFDNITNFSDFKTIKSIMP